MTGRCDCRVSGVAIKRLIREEMAAASRCLASVPSPAQDPQEDESGLSDMFSF
jgi:hypothetical protein